MGVSHRTVGLRRHRPCRSALVAPALGRRQPHVRLRTAGTDGLLHHPLRRRSRRIERLAPSAQNRHRFCPRRRHHPRCHHHLLWGLGYTRHRSCARVVGNGPLRHALARGESKHSLRNCTDELALFASWSPHDSFGIGLRRSRFCRCRRRIPRALDPPALRRPRHSQRQRCRRPLCCGIYAHRHLRPTHLYVDGCGLFPAFVGHRRRYGTTKLDRQPSNRRSCPAHRTLVALVLSTRSRRGAYSLFARILRCRFDDRSSGSLFIIQSHLHPGSLLRLGTFAKPTLSAGGIELFGGLCRRHGLVLPISWHARCRTSPDPLPHRLFRGDFTHLQPLLSLCTRS